MFDEDEIGSFASISAAQSRGSFSPERSLQHFDLLIEMGGEQT